MTIAPCAWASVGERRRVRRLDEARSGRSSTDGRAGRRARPAVGQRRLEVRGARPVRRPDLDQPRAGPPDDLRDPDAAADLDELAARDGDAAPAGKPDGERQRRGIVVGDERVLGAGQGDEVLLGDPEPRRRAAPSRGRARAASSRAAAAAAASIASPATAPDRGWCGRSRPSR